MPKHASKKIPQTAFEEELTRDIGEFYDDPLGFVMYAFPWGEGDLEGFEGPDEWQTAQLERIRKKIQGDPDEYVIREAIASGHGIGKSAETSFVILWAMSTRPHMNGVITANTTTQLSSKTWRELALWHKRSINRHWFEWTATKFFHIEHPETWFTSAIPNTEHNSEAFAGLHSRHNLIIYDEASGIPDKIWEVSEGAMTDPRSIWLAYGNPTKNTGKFRSCFAEDAARWTHKNIDSRSCMMTNKAELENMIATYGEDSDFVRVRIKGQFPRAGSMQFISSDWVDWARQTEIPPEVWQHLPIVIGVDVARYGDDKTVITVRQGRKLHRQLKFRELNTMEVAAQVAGVINEYKKTGLLAATFVDGVGLGAGVVDRLNMLNYEIVEVNGGAKPYDDVTYYNKNAEMWDRMRAWIRDGADMPKDDPDLRSALIGREYGFDDKERIRLERKADMKKRGMDSPDEGDSLAYTFAEELGDIHMRSFEPEDDSFEPDMEVA